MDGKISIYYEITIVLQENHTISAVQTVKQNPVLSPLMADCIKSITSIYSFQGIGWTTFHWAVFAQC